MSSLTCEHDSYSYKIFDSIDFSYIIPVCSILSQKQSIVQICLSYKLAMIRYLYQKEL